MNRQLVGFQLCLLHSLQRGGGTYSVHCCESTTTNFDFHTIQKPLRWFRIQRSDGDESEPALFCSNYFMHSSIYFEIIISNE